MFSGLIIFALIYFVQSVVHMCIIVQNRESIIDFSQTIATAFSIMDVFLHASEQNV